MKVIKPKTKVVSAVKTNTKEEEKENKRKSKKSLPPDNYEPIFEPSNLVVDDNRQFVIKVQRGGDDGLPCVDIRTFSTTEAYTGYTRKGINFPLEMLPDLIEILEKVSEESDERGLYDEFNL